MTGVQFVSARQGFLTTCQQHKHHCPTRLLATNDAGHHWHLVSRSVPEPMTFASADLGFAVHHHCSGRTCKMRVVRTVDGGKKWVTLTRLTFASGHAVYFESSLDFVSTQIGFVSISGAILRTVDGGRTWRQLPPVCTMGDMTSASFPTSTTGFAICEGEPMSDLVGKTLWETDDAGSTWHVASLVNADGKTPLGRLPYAGYGSRLSFLSPTTGFLMAERNGLLRTTTSGRTFREMIFTDDVDDVVATSWVTPRLGYVALGFEGLLRTRDGGRHWRVAYRGARHWPQRGVRTRSLQPQRSGPGSALTSRSVPTCAPNGEPWASPACPESVWAREIIAAAGGRIVGGCDGIEPQRADAFDVSLRGYRFCMGAISRNHSKKMGAYFSMGQFGGGMPDAGKVSGVPVFGTRRGGHWEWQNGGYSVEVYATSSNARRFIPLWKLTSLVTAKAATTQEGA